MTTTEAWVEGTPYQVTVTWRARRYTITMAPCGPYWLGDLPTGDVGLYRGSSVEGQPFPRWSASVLLPSHDGDYPEVHLESTGYTPDEALASLSAKVDAIATWANSLPPTR